jgi:hypothetical protein
MTDELMRSHLTFWLGRDAEAAFAEYLTDKRQHEETLAGLVVVDGEQDYE